MSPNGLHDIIDRFGTPPLSVNHTVRSGKSAGEFQMTTFRLSAMGAALAVVMAGASVPALAQTAGGGTQGEPVERVYERGQGPARPYSRGLDIRPVFSGTVYEFEGGEHDGRIGWAFALRNLSGEPVISRRAPGRFQPPGRAVLATGERHPDGRPLFRGAPDAFAPLWVEGRPEVLTVLAPAGRGTATPTLVLVTEPGVRHVVYSVGDRRAVGRYESAEIVKVSLDGGDDGPTDEDLGLPPDPGLVSLETIEGIDSNGNGLRDEVERVLTRVYRDSPSLLQTQLMGARDMTEAILIGARGTRDDARKREASESARDYIVCLHKFAEANDKELGWTGERVLEIEALMLNTDERSRAFWRYSSYLNGMTFDVDTERSVDCSIGDVRK